MKFKHFFFKVSLKGKYSFRFFWIASHFTNTLNEARFVLAG